MAGASAADRTSTTGGDAVDAPAAAPRYFAFISYSHQDEAWATWLHKSLETYRVPSRLVGQTTAHGTIPRRLLPIFRDRDELASATDLGRKVNEALAQSANLIVICSPNSATSRWVNEEILAYKRLGNADRIFCLIVDGEPNASDLPGREAEECFAPALSFELDADGQPTSQRTEPVAADARDGKDGKPNAKLKLIAGMLDVGFDTLKQRELQRRNRRLAAITALALIVMAITTTLAITAGIARKDAERRQKQAEDLVGFMLGDLNDRLAEVHRLDILEAVDDKAMQYFSSLPTRDVSDAALEQRVIALQKIGSVRMDQGHLPRALESYRAAASLAEELVRRAPDDVARRSAYADSLKWVGQNLWFQGELDQALKNFRTAADLLQRDAATRPDDTQLAFKLGVVRNNIGHVLEAHGDLVGAKLEYEGMQKIFASLAAAEPRNPQWQTYLASSENNLGKIALQQGSISGALAAYRVDQGIKAALFARDPQNHDAQEALLLSNAIFGRTLALYGALPEALRYTQDAVKSAQDLMAFDTKNPAWRELYGLYNQQFGRLLRQQHRLGDAAEADAVAVRTLAALVDASGTNSDFKQELGQSQLELARLLFERGDVAEAKRNAQAGLAVLDELAHAKEGGRALLLLRAQGNLLLGRLAAGDDAAAARSFWEKTHDLVSSVQDTTSDPNFLAVASSALILLDQPEQAAPLLQRLSESGFRDVDFVALVAAKGISYAVDTSAAERIEHIVRGND